MKKLTKREKVLIYALLMVGIVAGMFMLLIKPAGELLTEAEALLADTQSVYDTMQMTIGDTTSLEQQVADAKAEVEAAANKLYEPMTSDELDTLITGMVHDHGLTPESLTIDAQTYVSVSAWLSAAADTAPTDGSTDTETAYSGAFQANRVSVVVSGSRQNVQALIDEAEGNEAMRVTSFTIQHSDNELAQTDANYVSAFVAFEIYSYDRTILGQISGSGEAE